MEKIANYESKREIAEAFECNSDIVEACVDNKVSTLAELESTLKYFFNKDLEHLACDNIYIERIIDIGNTTRNLDNDEVFSILIKYFTQVKVREILSEYKISTGKLYRIVNKYTGRDIDSIKAKNAEKKAAKAVSLETKTVPTINNKNHKKSTAKKSINNHQKEKIIKNNDAKAAPYFKCIENEVSNKVYDGVDWNKLLSDNEKITKLKVREDDRECVFAGLIADRHHIKDINRFIFKESLPEDKLFDYQYQEDIVRGFINYNIRFNEDGTPQKKLLVYCTGLQSALASVFKVCEELKIDLALMHYNNQTDKYNPQVIRGVWNFDSPFRNYNADDVYGYDCSYDDIINADEDNLHCIVLSTKDKLDKSSKFGKSKLIVINGDIEKAFEAFNYFSINMLKEGFNRRYLDAVLLNKAAITEYGFVYRNSEAKSFNYTKAYNN